MSRLDADIREAFEALERSTPEDTFEQLPIRVAARLEREDDNMEGSQQGEHMSKRGSDTPPPPAPKAREENTGLHDIKAMARTTKQRISRRHSTQSEAEEALLASSSSALSAVALPEPGKDKERYATEERAAVAAAPAKGAVADEPRTGMPVWIYAAVAVVAAAAVVVFVVRGRGGDKAAANDQVAMNEPAAAPPEPTVETAPPPAPPTEPVAAAEPALGAVADDGETGEPEVTPMEQTETETDTAAAAPKKADERAASKSSGSRTRSGSSTSKTTSSSSSKSTASKPDEATKTAAGGDSGEPGAGTTTADGDKSIDDLLSEATGVSGDEGGGGKTAGGSSKPTKKELTRADIQSGMRKVMGTARGCGEKHATTGQVMVSLTISPSGSVSSAKATGEFAGTPVGGCVAAAVKGASFPAWDGPPHSMSYPFLVTE